MGRSAHVGSFPDEPELVERVRRGDEEAFEALLDRYADRAFAVAYGFLQHPQDSEDLVQDAFVRALERIDSLAPGSPFGPWFYRLVANTALNRRRYLARRRTEEIEPQQAAASGGSDPSRAAELAELRRELSRALRSLPAELETVVVLHDLEGFTHVEIAEVMGLPEGTCRSHLHRARRLLREKLEEYQHHTP